MVADKISIETIYLECNNHLREMDKNRDQIISFYIILVGAFLAVIDAKSQTQIIKDLGTLSTLVLSVLGLLVSVTANEYRKWHTRYSYTSTLLVALGRDDHRSFEEIEKDVRADTFSKSHLMKSSKFTPMNWFFKRYLRGTEFYTYLASLVITLIPIYLFLHTPMVSNPLYHVQSQWGIPYEVTVLFLLLIYVLLCIIISARHLYNEFTQCPWAKWLLSRINYKFDLTYDSKKGKQAI